MRRHMTVANHESCVRVDIDADLGDDEYWPRGGATVTVFLEKEWSSSPLPIIEKEALDRARAVTEEIASNF